MKLLEREQRKLEKASRRRLVIKWSKKPDSIALHDPPTGECHEVRTSECLLGVVESADRRPRKKGEG